MRWSASRGSMLASVGGVFLTPHFVVASPRRLRSERMRNGVGYQPRMVRLCSGRPERSPKRASRLVITHRRVSERYSSIGLAELRNDNRTTHVNAWNGPQSSEPIGPSVGLEC